MGMSKVAAQVLDRVAPQLAANMRCWRYQRELTDIFDRLVAENGGSVLSGPFRGMAYASAGIPGAMAYRYTSVPKLLGCYEMELHGVVKQTLTAGYDTILDVGCAEGYYVAGLARLLPRAHVFAFDINPAARGLCQKMAEVNGVETRVTVLGECTPAEIGRLSSGKTLIVSDCEGHELNLLQPGLAPGLRHCDVLVELHPHVDASIATEIPNRFAATHSMTMLHGQPRDLGSFPALSGFSDRAKRLAVSEFREGVAPWAFFASQETSKAMCKRG